MSPCEKYDISEDNWKEFKKIHEDPTWEEKRTKKHEVAKLNNAPHTMAQGEYNFIEVREIERKMKEHKEEASKSREDVIIDPRSPSSRHQKRKLGRQKRSGGVSSYAAREIVTKIVVVEKVVDGSAEAPLRTEEDIERPEPPKKHARQDDRSSHKDTMRDLFSVAATLFSNSLQVP
ncbi:hypothetical protein OROMI_015231 [Orobanche minor]